MFEGPNILESFCERIILPNMVLRSESMWSCFIYIRPSLTRLLPTAFEEEMFEDDAFEYVRRDLLETAGCMYLYISDVNHQADLHTIFQPTRKHGGSLHPTSRER
jgi:hypothetical protein